MKISRHLDWLSASVRDGRLLDPRDIFPSLNWQYVQPGQHGYKCVLAAPECPSLRFSTQGPCDMPAMLMTVPGAALSWLRENIVDSDAALMQHMAQFSTTYSRVDLAINLHGCKMTPDTLQSAIEKGRAVAASRNPPRRIEQDEGVTVEVGSRLSERYLRCYDKAAESKMDKNSEAWIRLELECKNVMANGAAGAIAEHGVDAVSSTMIGDYLKWKNREYQAAIHVERVTITPIAPPEKPDQREKWLITVCAPALARQERLNPAILDAFLAAFAAERDYLDKS